MSWILVGTHFCNILSLVRNPFGDQSLWGFIDQKSQKFSFLKFAKQTWDQEISKLKQEMKSSNGFQSQMTTFDN